MSEQDTRAPFPNYEPNRNNPVKTWLDECAFSALASMAVAMGQGYWEPGENPNKELAEASYQIAAAMLAEKLRREKVEADQPADGTYQKGTE